MNDLALELHDRAMQVAYTEGLSDEALRAMRLADFEDEDGRLPDERSNVNSKPCRICGEPSPTRGRYAGKCPNHRNGDTPYPDNTPAGEPEPGEYGYEEPERLPYQDDELVQAAVAVAEAKARLALAEDLVERRQADLSDLLETLRGLLA